MQVNIPFFHGSYMGVWLLKGYHGHPIYHLLKESEAPWKWPYSSWASLGNQRASSSYGCLKHKRCSKWWQLKYIFYFHPGKWGKISNLTSIFFQMGWNHQPQKRCCSQSLGNSHQVIQATLWWPNRWFNLRCGDQTSSPNSLEVTDNTIEKGSRETHHPKKVTSRIARWHRGCFLMCLLCCHPKWEHTPREAP